MILLVAVINLILVIILVFLIRRNILRLEKKNNGSIINAKVNKWKVLNGQPTRYVLEVEYEMKNKKYKKWLITSGKFAKKYEKEIFVPIVIIQDTNEIYFKEEDWKKQNIFLFILIIIMLPGLIISVFCSFLEILKVCSM